MLANFERYINMKDRRYGPGRIRSDCTMRISPLQGVPGYLEHETSLSKVFWVAKAFEKAGGISARAMPSGLATRLIDPGLSLVGEFASNRVPESATIYIISEKGINHIPLIIQTALIPTVLDNGDTIRTPPFIYSMPSTLFRQFF